MIETVKYGQEPRPGLILPPWFPEWKKRASPWRRRHGECNMLWVPQKGILRVEHNTGSVGTLTPGTSVTPGTASKGTPAEIFAATAFDSYWMILVVSNVGQITVARRCALDILIGASAEHVMIPDLLCGHAGRFNVVDVRGPKMYAFPIYVPAGSRIAAQAQTSTSTTAFQVAMYLYGGHGLPPYRVGSGAVTYGVSGVDGVAITPGASGAEGAWAEIAASSSQDHFAFSHSFQIGNDTSVNIREYSVDVGIGDATEEVIGEGYIYCTDDNETLEGPHPNMPMFADVPSGTRLVMRASNSGTNDGAYNGALHGVT